MNILPKLGMRNNTKHPVIDRRGNVLYVTVGISDRYWKDIEEGRGAIVCTEHDVTDLLDEKNEPKDARCRAQLERYIEPHRAAIAERRHEAYTVYDPPMLASAVAQKRASKEAIAAAVTVAAMSGRPVVESPDVAALREQNAALLARLEKLEAAQAAPAAKVK